ncbi:hypothetical protein OROMI_033097 [Orobanche minor]
MARDEIGHLFSLPTPILFHHPPPLGPQATRAAIAVAGHTRRRRCPLSPTQKPHVAVLPLKAMKSPPPPPEFVNLIVDLRIMYLGLIFFPDL